MLDFVPPDSMQFWLTTIKNVFNNLLAYWFMFPFIGLFLYLVFKYTDRSIFWVRIICGAFGDWKTYNNSLKTKDYADKWFFIISNIRNSFTNLKFDSVLDLERIYAYIMEYARITNNKEFIENWFRPIVFNIDEAHNYFFSRSFEKNLNKDNLMVTTQCRKRSILNHFITQELAQLDVFFRRLCGGDVMRYYAWLWFVRFWRQYYVPNPETTNLNSEEEWVEIKKRWIYLAPNFLTFLSKNRRFLLPEKYISKIIVWYEDLLLNYSFMDFLKDLYPIDTKNGRNFWEIYKIKEWNKQIKTFFEDDVFIRKERDNIKLKLDEMNLYKQKKMIEKFQSMLKWFDEPNIKDTI
jgi:hypothetical protein